MLCHCHRSLLASSLLLLAILGPAADTTESMPTPKQIAQWVEQLGDNDFQVRENASKKLWQAGAAAETVLEKAAKSNDPEVVRRARDLLDKFRWGIYPDTPADIVALIRAYQSSKGNPRMEVLKTLLDKGDAGLRAALKIAAAEKDENQRKVLGNLIAEKLSPAFFLAVTEGKYRPFERLLEIGHEGKVIDHHQYAAYWLLRGKLVERIARFTARLCEHPEDTWIAQTLAYLHRANGDLVQARKAAEKSGRDDLIEGILYEMGDWKALAERADFAATKNTAERWAYRAAFARLAGKHKEFDNAVRELRKLAVSSERDPSSAWVAAKGLLLNDRPTEGMDMLRTRPEFQVYLFDILCARLDFAAAIDLAVKAVPTDKEIPDLALAHARLLCLLGNKKEGQALFDRYAEHIKDGIDPIEVNSLLTEEIRAGLKDRAFVHAAKALSVAPPRSTGPIIRDARWHLYFETLFPQQTETAEEWWIVLRRKFKDESPSAVLKHLRQLMEGKIAAKEVKAWIKEAEEVLSLLPQSDSSRDRSKAAPQRKALAEAAAKAGLDDLAVALLKKADSRDALLRLGDLLAAKKQWEKAAERYRQAWTKQLRSEERNTKSHDPLPLYLAGDALVRAGQEKEGKRLIEQAHWLPFADVQMRYNFLSALIQRGHKEAARRESELLLRVGEPNSFYSGLAIRRLALAALARKDYLQAAEGFEQSMLRCFHSSINFVSNAAYASVPAQIHQLRASALLAVSKFDEALKHAELALADSPGYVDLPIALVPELERRGHKKEATDLFNRCYGAYEKVCCAYPHCAWAHNSAAWMAACCRRNLDAALEHAQKAVELAPTHAGYLDTLAEVHFQRGDKDKAVALQERAIELDPKKSYYRKQLKRLEAGDPSAERPPENDEE